LREKKNNLSNFISNFFLLKYQIILGMYMVEYKCLNCKKIIKFEELGNRARCPHCSYKILVKLRPKVVKHVKAR